MIKVELLAPDFSRLCAPLCAPVCAALCLDDLMEEAGVLWASAAGPWRRGSAGDGVGYRAGYGAGYTVGEQDRRERAYDRALDEVERVARRAAGQGVGRGLGQGRGRVERKLVRAFARFAAEALDLGPESVDLLTHSFLPAGTQLARWARRFDAGLSQADIVQACRNGWTACGLQPLLGTPIAMTRAIAAYSLLYPYSDNYLDERKATHEEKLRFSRRFRARLSGDVPVAEGAHEAAVWELVRRIECQFPRDRFEEVFSSLLAIHDAQVASLVQLEDCGRLSERTLFEISCAKGGTSVLADGYLVRGTLRSVEREFSFLWGVLLQLGDDLQDVEEDLQGGSDTLFTRAVRRGEPLDALTAQLLNFGAAVALRMDALPHGDPIHKALMRMSWRSLILMAVGQAQRNFTPEFARQAEACSPFRFAFLRERREKLQGRAGVFRRLFEIMLSGEDSGKVRCEPIAGLAVSGCPIGK